MTVKNINLSYIISKHLQDQVSLTAVQIEKLEKFISLLHTQAVPYGFLSHQTSLNDIYIKHILDSLLSLHSISLVDMILSSIVIDVGTGAGLPGIPLAITYPKIPFYLIDSHTKKMLFIEQCTQILDLKNISTIRECVRLRFNLDSYLSEEYKQKARLIIFRALLPPIVSLEIILPLLREGDNIAYWGAKRWLTEAEEKQMYAMGYQLQTIDKLPTVDDISERNIYIIKKERPSNAKYPRSLKAIKKVTSKSHQ